MLIDYNGYGMLNIVDHTIEIISTLVGDKIVRAHYVPNPHYLISEVLISGISIGLKEVCI